MKRREISLTIKETSRKKLSLGTDEDYLFLIVTKTIPRHTHTHSYALHGGSL